MFKFMLTILEAVAVIERDLTVERIKEEISKAKKYGTRSGNPIGRTSRQILPSAEKYYKIWKAGEVTAAGFAWLMKVSRPSMYYYVGEYESVI